MLVEGMPARRPCLEGHVWKARSGKTVDTYKPGASETNHFLIFPTKKHAPRNDLKWSPQALGLSFGPEGPLGLSFGCQGAMFGVLPLDYSFELLKERSD